MLDEIRQKELEESNNSSMLNNFYNTIAGIFSQETQENEEFDIDYLTADELDKL